MKMKLTVNLGLGDVISQNFLDTNYGEYNPVSRQLARMLFQYKQHVIGTNPKISDIGIANNSNNPEAVREIFAALGIQVYKPQDIADWKEADLAEPADIQPVIFPTIQPNIVIPQKYILFNELASISERYLTDPLYYRIIKKISNIPVIKVGRGHSICPCDIDLTNMVSIPEVAWLAANAVCVISSLTFHRVWASLFGTPVIELCEEGRTGELIMEKTAREYRDREYGLLHDDRSRWFKMPMQTEAFADLLTKHLKVSGTDTASIELPKSNQIKGMAQHWDIQSSASTRSLMNRITSADDFQADEGMLEWLNLDKTKPLKILDFGAGMLRCSSSLVEMSKRWEITAYDTHVMLDRGVKHYRLQNKIKEHRLKLSSSWDDLKVKKYDLIFCSLVLQHVLGEALPELIEDFSQMSPKLFVVGRRALDNYSDKVWPFVLKLWKPTGILNGGGTKNKETSIADEKLFEQLVVGEMEDHHAVIFKLKGT